MHFCPPLVPSVDSMATGEAAASDNQARHTVNGAGSHSGHEEYNQHPAHITVSTNATYGSSKSSSFTGYTITPGAPSSYDQNGYFTLPKASGSSAISHSGVQPNRLVTQNVALPPNEAGSIPPTPSLTETSISRSSSMSVHPTPIDGIFEFNPSHKRSRSDSTIAIDDQAMEHPYKRQCAPPLSTAPIKFNNIFQETYTASASTDPLAIDDTHQEGPPPSATPVQFNSTYQESYTVPQTQNETVPHILGINARIYKRTKKEDLYTVEQFDPILWLAQNWTKDGPKIFCPICANALENERSAAVRHLLTHSDLSRMYCPCGSDFCRLDSFIRHVREEEDECVFWLSFNRWQDITFRALVEEVNNLYRMEIQRALDIKREAIEFRQACQRNSRLMAVGQPKTSEELIQGRRDYATMYNVIHRYCVDKNQFIEEMERYFKIL